MQYKLPVVSEKLVAAIAEGKPVSLPESLRKLANENPQLVLLGDTLTKGEVSPLIAIAVAYGMLAKQIEIDWLEKDAPDSNAPGNN